MVFVNFTIIRRISQDCFPLTCLQFQELFYIYDKYCGSSHINGNRRGCISQDRTFGACRIGGIDEHFFPSGAFFFDHFEYSIYILIFRILFLR